MDTELRTKIENFIHGNDISITNAKEIESSLYDAYPQDDDVDDIIDDLALYCLGGGGYFYDETHIKRKLLSLIKKYP